MCSRDVEGECVKRIEIDNRVVGRAASAAKEYLKRKEKTSWLRGLHDKGGRWHPDKEERQDCCHTVYRPSREYPLSLYRHCLSIRHVASLFNADKREVIKLLHPGARSLLKL